MPAPDDDIDRRFDELVHGAGLDGPVAEPLATRPFGHRILTVRAELDESSPPIWRELEVRDQLTLDILHEILQVAFGWEDRHLHRFSVGGRPFDDHAIPFLCRSDIEDGEEGQPEHRFSIRSTLTGRDARLHYLYDYGDAWQVTLTLVSERDASPGDPVIRATAGEGAAPPDDSGGLVDGAPLAHVIDDPTAFDLDQLNASYRSEFFALLLFGVDPRLLQMVDRLHDTEPGAQLAWRLMDLLVPRPGLTDEEREKALAPHLWFLDQATGDGMPLTAAGYIKPDAVTQAARLVPSTGDWMGKLNRESETPSVLQFRLGMQRLGLIRKVRGRLLITRKGVRARNDLGYLWDLLRDAALPDDATGYVLDETLLTLLHAATSMSEMIDRTAIATTLAALGWRDPDGLPPRPSQVAAITEVPRSILRDVGRVPWASRSRGRPSTAARALALDALTRGPRW